MLELIPGVAFAFGSCCWEQTTCVKRRMKQTDGINVGSQQFGSYWERKNPKRPGRPQKTTRVDGRRTLSMVKKNPFTASAEVRNALRVHHMRGRMHHKLETSLKNRNGLNHLKEPDQVWSGFCGQMRRRSTCTRTNGRGTFRWSKAQHVL